MFIDWFGVILTFVSPYCLHEIINAFKAREEGHRDDRYAYLMCIGLFVGAAGDGGCFSNRTMTSQLIDIIDYSLISCVVFLSQVNLTTWRIGDCRSYFSSLQHSRELPTTCTHPYDFVRVGEEHVRDGQWARLMSPIIQLFRKILRARDAKSTESSQVSNTGGQGKGRSQVHISFPLLTHVVVQDR